MPGARAIATMIAMAALLAACRGGTGAGPTVAASSPSEAPTSVSTSPSQVRPLGTRVWLAGLRVASDPRDFNQDTQLIMSRVDGALVETPAICFKGLPEGIAATDYIMGVVAGTHAELDQFITASGFDALFEVRVRVRAVGFCVD